MRTQLVPLTTRNHPLVDGEHHVGGGLESLDDGYDVLLGGMYVGACFAEAGGVARVEVRLNEFGISQLDEVLVAVRRGIDRPVEIVGVDDYVGVFTTGGWEETERGWRAEPIAEGTCVWCHRRPATEQYAESALEMTHGGVERVCERCLAERQLRYAESAAERIPALRARLAELDA